MQTLKYKVIKTKKQYKDYCKILEQLDTNGNETLEEEMELLTLLIEKWDEQQNSFHDVDPIVLIKALMSEKNIKAQHLVNESGLSKSLISDILNYKKAMSKDVIRFFAGFFKLSQESLNRPYKLSSETNTLSRKKSKMQHPRKLVKQPASAKRKLQTI